MVFKFLKPITWYEFVISILCLLLVAFFDYEYNNFYKSNLCLKQMFIILLLSRLMHMEAMSKGENKV